MFCCIVSNFYIKSQLNPVRSVNPFGCIVSNFYIKSQQSHNRLPPISVVQYPISTSNHNALDSRPAESPVVQYPISTSNHNGEGIVDLIPGVVQYPISTSNHNRGCELRSLIRLYSIQFLHQITTPKLLFSASQTLYSIQFLHQITT